MRLPLALALLAFAAPAVRAASLDVTASYKMKAVEYKNIDTGQDVNNQSFLENDARLGIAVKKIVLNESGGEDTTLDLGLLLHALGVSGSTSPISSPFSRAAANYPTANLTPFIENAYVRVNRLFGENLEATFGRQNFRLGSGLLLDDDGAGFTGATVRTEIPWESIKVEGFVFQDKDPQALAPNSLTLFGLSVSVPTEGTWQFNELMERDQATQLVYGCTYPGNPDAPPHGNGCAVSKSLKSFSSARYQISYGPMVFDGEAAMEKGVATPTNSPFNPGGSPAGNHITYNADAEVVKMKWKQSLYHTGEGIARISIARGTGDNPGTPTRDEAFYPAHGHQYDGLERSGFGDFYSATPYSAMGGNYAVAGASATKSGLPPNASGIVVVGVGYTPPAFRGFVLDLDGYLYQSERGGSPGSTLGNEWDFHFRYPIRDQFLLSVGVAYFKAGLVTDPNRGISRKYTFQASGRF